MAKSVYTQEYHSLLHKLHQARQEAGLTQSRVARLLKKPQSYVSKCESGERRVDPVELKHFAKIYKKSFDFFTY